jgi:uncharacterized protein (TIGR03435 family)
MALVWKRRLSRSVVLCILTAGVPCAGALLSQVAVAQAAPAAKTDIVDSWQGTLHVGRDLRTILKIEKAPDGTLKSTLFSIDQGANSIAAKTTTFAGGTLKVSIEAIDGTYEGKMSPDGTTITGTFTQGDRPNPLILVRATAETVWAIPAPPPKIPPMDPNADPNFEVATIKPTDPSVQGKGFRVNGRKFSTLNTSLLEIIAFTYGVQQKQVVGGPAWMGTDHFDLSAQPDLEGQPSDKQWKSMIKKLLAERFGLKFHADKREMAAYVLTVAPGGNKMTPNPSGGALPGLGFGRLGRLTARNATMTDFAGLMQSTVFDRPVVNNTALDGRWDFVLKWTPDETQFPDAPAAMKVAPPQPDAADAPPSVYKAMQEQLGLKLESTKAQVDVMVVDHVEKPTDN